MHKNESLYYCFLPNTRTEKIIPVRKELESCPGYLCGCLYEVDQPLGQATFDILSLASDLLQTDKSSNPPAITDAAIYNCFRRMEITAPLAKTFLQRCLDDARQDPSDVNYLHANVWSFNKLIRPYIDTKVSCPASAFERFCRKNHRGISGGEIVQLDLEDYLGIVGIDVSTEDTLEILLKSYPFRKGERKSIQKAVSPYMDNPQEFCKVLKEWLTKYDPKAGLIITYHIYKLNNVYDLFSATLKEIITAKRPINRCEYCGQLFVTVNRSDEKYCVRCKENAESVLSECTNIYNAHRTWLSTYGDEGDLDEFLIANAVERGKTRQNIIAAHEYKSWLEKEKGKRHK